MEMTISAIEKLTSEITGFDTPICDKEMLRWQLSQIRSAMLRAAEKNASYAKRFSAVNIFSIDSFEALSKIPFTYPDEIIKHPDAFVCEAERDIARVTSLRTSGSMGEPKRICFSDSDLLRTVRLFELGMAPIIGNGKRCLIMMSDPSQGSIASLLKEGVERHGTPAVIYGNIHDVDDAAAAVLDGDVIVGIPAQIIHLCRKYPKLRPASVLLSADYVPATAVPAIRELWQCRVYTHYGMTETCFGCAVQCSETSAQHLRHDALLIEIIDPLTGRQLKAGEEGEIVMTTFSNKAMPIFRYRTGDISSLVVGRCECGSVLPRLGLVKGRLKNRIKVGGAVFCIEAIDDLLYKNPDLWQYEAEIHGVGDNIQLRINAVGSKDLKVSDLHYALSEVLPPVLDVKITTLESLMQPFKKRQIAVR